MTEPPPFHDLADYVATPRLTGVALSPDGERLIATVQTLDAKRSGYVTALWELDATGVDDPVRLTHGVTGESLVGFTATGDVLFASKRSTDDDDPRTPLFLLPRSGGEARPVVRRAGGVSGAATARTAGTIVLASPTLAGASTDNADDREAAKARSDSKVSAILHDRYPVRFWDHDIGPASTRLLVADPTPAPSDAGADEQLFELRDLLGHVPGRLSDEARFDLSADGSVLVTDWQRPTTNAEVVETVVRIDVATGDITVLADDPEMSYSSPRLSPDGTHVVMNTFTMPTPDRAPVAGLAIVSVDGGDIRPLADDWDLWPSTAEWTPDGSSIIVVADELGHAPLYRVDVATGERTRLTGDGAFRSPHVSNDGRWILALRSHIDHPDIAVRVAIDGSGVDTLKVPTPSPTVPGTVETVTSTAADGSPLHSFVVLPEGASAESPAPLVLWIHGGPLGSWNEWSWRWNPWLMAAAGYAVLLPDPALSTGYGQGFIQRGWGAWGGPPYEDLMTITDAALERDDLDASRTAAMGGSFGGYMANWVAGHTDRFDAIVTHASLWDLDQFGPTTDAAYYWAREMTPEMATANSPSKHLDRIGTPMLVIHGDRDYRVPIGEALRLWFELVRESADEDGNTPHRFLYYPDENHWILTPNNAQAWYATVLAFLAQHVRGEDWVEPPQITSTPTSD
ncbi:MAG: alpha/beta fold hydrolase [Actinomycetota bacterium]